MYSVLNFNSVHLHITLIHWFVQKIYGLAYTSLTLKWITLAFHIAFSTYLHVTLLKKNAHRIFNYPFKPTNVNWGFWLSPVFIYYPRKQFSEKQLQQEAMAAHLPPKVMPGWMPVKLIICLFTNWLVDGQNNESQSSTTHARFIQAHYWFFLNFKYSVFLLILVFPP